MEKVREVIRLHELGFCQREIHRHLGIARSCIQRYLIEFELSLLTYKQVKDVSDSELKELLKCKKIGRKSKAVSTEPDFEYIFKELTRRKGTTLELLWVEWSSQVSNSYGYSSFCRKYREWSKEQKVWMRQDYPGGEKCLVDYAGECLEYFDEKSGTTQKVEIFVGTLGASNKIFAQATLSQRLEDFQCSHVAMFEYFGGVPKVVIVDNLKSAVTRSDKYEPVINRIYKEMADHYGIAILPARARKPQDKGKVEKSVQIVEQRILAPLRNEKFKSLAEINQAIQPRLTQLNKQRMRDYGMSREELFERADQPHLTPLPTHRYTPQTWQSTRVSMDYHVQVGKHYYSVPYYLCRKEVWVRSTQKLVDVFYENELVTSHLRSQVEFESTTKDQHMPKHHLAHKSRSREQFLKWATTIGPETLHLTKMLFEIGTHEEQGYRSVLGLKRLGEKYGHLNLETAAAKANDSNIISQRFVRVTLEELLKEKNKQNLTVTHENIRGSTYFH